MSGPLLDEKVITLSRSFEAAGVPHAFGGALALAYYATPRGTVDIDANVFVPGEEAERVLATIEAVGVRRAPDDVRRIRRDGQVRLRWGHTPIDLFFSYDALHERCLARRRSVPFGGDDAIWILSAEDLAVFKVIFDRPKDWTDLEEMIFALGPDFDAEDVLAWLGRILEDDDPRLARFRSLASG
jgi:hypothetical protein